jgi:integrase
VAENRMDMTQSAPSRVTTRHLILRGQRWYLKRQVPVAFQHVEDRQVIWKALAAQTEKGAEKEADRVWTKLLAGWRAQIPSPGETAFEEAHRQARQIGIHYLPVDIVAELPLPELLDRVEAVLIPDGQIDLDRAQMFLGGVQVSYTLSACFARYLRYTEIARYRLSPRQRAQWVNVRRNAVSRLIDVIGDVDIRYLHATEIYRARTEWGNASHPSLSNITINGWLCRVSGVLKELALREDVKPGFDPRTAVVRNQFHTPRPSFLAEWIKSRILGEGALDGLDLQAKSILLALINTGCRLSEIANLMPEEIILEGSLPHIRLTGKLRPLKTSAAYRDIPLIGVSLQAMQACPDGFPEYRDRASLSAKLNRYLRKMGLVEKPRQTVHSLRHSFEDRVYSLPLAERMRCDLMGHKYQRAAYGKGSTLEMKADVIAQIAL